MGHLYWITGLAGAGKSSLARRLFETLKPQQPALVYLDGDTLREVLESNGQYEEAQRFQIAMQYARLCQLLTTQGIDVICATVSMFDDVRAWNRKNITDYTEIYLEVPFPILQTRNQHGLYSGQTAQQIKNVVGCDIDAQFPKNPDIVLSNDGDLSIDELAQRLLEQI
ncbi:MAG: adenylyl-sulfate kinase [Gammaproteobacteria bacterium]|nr:adenylyl-sulfate kinase [Gammaproteobacteria bacterium]